MSRNISRIFVLRHGERADQTFGDAWISKCFDSAGNYTPYDLNMLQELPKRTNGGQGWVKDSPLTNVGVLQARLIGEALRRKGIKIHRAYSSPAFRSIHTCSAALEGLGQSDEVKVNVDCGLFEWFGWHREAGAKTIDWLSTEQLKSVAINVNEAYEPKLNSKDMFPLLSETMEEFEERAGDFIAEIAASAQGENILLVAHGPTGQVAQQRLRGKPMISEGEMNLLMPLIPYCSFIGLERDLSKGPHWTLLPDRYSVTHQLNRTWNPETFGV